MRRPHLFSAHSLEEEPMEGSAEGGPIRRLEVGQGPVLILGIPVSGPPLRDRMSSEGPPGRHHHSPT